MKKPLLIFTIIFTIIFLIGTIYYIYINNIYSNNIEIIEYKNPSFIISDTTKVTDKSDIKKLNNYLNKINLVLTLLPNKEEQLKLALLEDVKIQYNDSVIISIQLGEENYCHYKNKEKNISSIVVMPEGLYQWVVKKLDL